MQPSLTGQIQNISKVDPAEGRVGSNNSKVSCPRTGTRSKASCPRTGARGTIMISREPTS